MFVLSLFLQVLWHCNYHRLKSVSHNRDPVYFPLFFFFLQLFLFNSVKLAQKWAQAHRIPRGLKNWNNYSSFVRYASRGTHLCDIGGPPAWQEKFWVDKRTFWGIYVVLKPLRKSFGTVNVTSGFTDDESLSGKQPILGLHMTSSKDHLRSYTSCESYTEYVQDCYALRFDAKFWFDTKHLPGAVDFWITWQLSRLSQSRPTKINACGWTVRCFFGRRRF